jgi:hypothetical protein
MGLAAAWDLELLLKPVPVASLGSLVGARLLHRQSSFQRQLQGERSQNRRFCSSSNKMPRYRKRSISLHNLRAVSSPPMNATRLWTRSALGGVILASLLLTSCQGAKEGMKQAGGGMGDAAKQAAGDAARTAVTPALAPLMDILNKGESQIKAGDVQGAMATMGGFEGVFKKVGPLIQPLAGDKWPAIEAAAQQVISTFGGATPPTAESGSGAITNLMGLLKGLKAS